MRRPLLFLIIALAFWSGAPAIHHGLNAVTLSAHGGIPGSMIGAVAGWISKWF